MDSMRTPSAADRWVAHLDRTVRAWAAVPQAQRARPAAAPTRPLTSEERRLSVALMRVNHVGEVCAQALYAAQALTTRDPALRTELTRAAQEEEDHLAWTAARLAELDGRPSWLNPLWWGGAFGLGLTAGLAGDAWSLGFVVETERQVEAHLAEHLTRLPEADAPSRAIVQQMEQDEAAHAAWAEARGARALPPPIPTLMRCAAKVMTTTAHRL
jgi:ubiquinone biosynthesis monooxygenase Coq7